MEGAGAILDRIMILVVDFFLAGLLDALLEGVVVMMTLMMMVRMVGLSWMMMKSSFEVRVIWKVFLSFCHPRVSWQVLA